MITQDPSANIPAAITDRAREIYNNRLDGIHRQTDRIFAVLFGLQWAFALLLACTASPRTWVVDQPYWHVHLWAALGLGGLLTAGPIFCYLTRPGKFSTRVVIAIAQVGYSSLLIHLTGGRIETHFHIFGSLAFLSFYRDWRVFVPATLIVAADHLVRGVFWPESVFGVISAAPWRAFEHAGWVIFEDIFLVWGCLTSTKELRERAQARAELEASKENIERKVEQRTSELAAERHMLDAILHSVGDGIIAVDENGKNLCFNRRAEQILGVDELDELSGQDWSKEYSLFELDGHTVVQPEDAPLYRAMQGESVENRELVVRQGADEKRVSMNATPLVSDSHRGGIVSIRDVTDKAQLESQLSEAQKLESIGQLAAGVAHEINTPMQYVSDNVEFLSECSERLFEVVNIYHKNLVGNDAPRSWQERMNEVDEAHKRCRFDYIREQVPVAITEAKEGVKRVIEIVRAMKLLSHPGSEGKTATDLNDAIRSAVVITKNRWKYAAELELELDEKLPTVKTLSAEINQVLLNLIVNAADAIIDRHGESNSLGRILVRTYASEGQVIIEVEDNGCGMPEEVRQRIFEPFFTTKEVGKGTGQGLAISFNVIVNHHDGVLDVRTRPGEGTTFVVALPLGDPTTTTANPQPAAEIISDFFTDAEAGELIG